MAEATDDIRSLTESVGTAEAAARVKTLLRNVDQAARNVAAGTDDLATLRASVDAAVAGAEALLASEDLAVVPALAREAVQGARDVLAAPEIDAILIDLAAAVSDIRVVAATVGTPEAAARIEDLLASVDEAARNVAAGTANLDTLRAAIDSAATGAQGPADLAGHAGRSRPSSGRARQTARDVLAAPEIDAILADVAATTAEIRTLTERIATDAVAARIESLLANVDAASRDVAAGTADLATLRTSLDAAVVGAESLLTSPDTQAIPGAASDALAEAGALAGDVRGLVTSPEIKALLTDLPAITADIRSITQELAEQQAATALTAALEAAQRAAASVAEGTADLPELSASTDRVLAQAETLAANLNALTLKANALELDALVDATTDLMRTSDAFLSSDEAGDIPVVLSATLEELRRTIETIRTGGTLDNVNATLTSAAGAADSVRLAASDLPALVGRLQALTDAATGVLSTYDSESRVAQELFAALRAATRAAEDVSSLSRTIERNPNSLLLGR